MGCTHPGSLRLLEDEDGNRGVHCPGCGMYAFGAGPHRHTGWRRFWYPMTFFLGLRQTLPEGVRAVGWEQPLRRVTRR